MLRLSRSSSIVSMSVSRSFSRVMLLRISATPCKAFSLYYTQDLGTLEKLVYIAILVGQRPSYFIIPSFSDSCHSTVLSPGKGSTCPSSIFLWSQEKDAGQAQDDADDLSGQQDVFIQQKAYSCQKKRYADIGQERGHADFPASPV